MFQTRLSVKGLVFTATIGFLLGVASLAVAGHSFIDVPDNHTFHGDIEWMRDNGITKGCNPPANDEYCPERFTSRGEMAAFMHRLALSRAVDAGTLDGLDSTDFLGTDDKAADSDLLDGKDSSQYIQVGDTASDSDLLDGKDSSDFLSSAVYVNPATVEWLIAVSNETAASCATGDLLIGGGYQAEGALAINVEDNFPDSETWRVRGTASAATDVTAYAICVPTN